MKRRIRVSVLGRVQGVGFRPSVYRHAVGLGLVGFVRNTAEGVLIEAEGAEDALGAMVELLKNSSPPHSRIDRMVEEQIAVEGDTEFVIAESRRSGDLLIGIPPELSTCPDCLRELFDPADRRWKYPFINCTNCGPRFTIAAELPYDREKTSMADFELCPDCRREFVDPADRRFDAQPNACPVCGPALKLLDDDGNEMEGGVERVVELLRQGAIVAVKGLGGYHLCCDALNPKALRKLRERKGRVDKPFAVMFQTLEQIAEYCFLDSGSKTELLSSASPIVILRCREGAGALPALIAPDTRDVGAFLPYTPVHHLLLREMGPLVMTSANLSEEPIAKDENDLSARVLGRIADFALTHNRRIIRRCDDSVVKIVNGHRLFLRRSRGWTPGAVRLPIAGPSVLACGADLKNTFCLTRGNEAIVSQHIGDLAEYPSRAFYQEAIDDLRRLLKAEPQVIAHDLHPAYQSTRFALEYPAASRVGVQHHHAHIASCMAEHGLTEKVIGVAFDGTGYGPDGTVWGGEFLVADLASYERAGRLKRYRLPGGEEGIRHPIRMAYSLLLAELPEKADEMLSSIPETERIVLRTMIERGTQSPWTSSAGRLFDGVSALLGLCRDATYEGQAAIRLQTAAGAATSGLQYDCEIEHDAGMLVLSFGSMIGRITADVRNGADIESVAVRFHRTVASGAAEVCARIRDSQGITGVVLSGGVFQNDLYLRLLTDELKKRGFKVYSHSLVPPNDAGVSLGQAAVALAGLS